MILPNGSVYFSHKGVICLINPGGHLEVVYEPYRIGLNLIEVMRQKTEDMRMEFGLRGVIMRYAWECLDMLGNFR